MKNYNLGAPSVSSILKQVSDDKTLTLFNSIAVSDRTKEISLNNLNLTTKQYYSRISGLLKTGLINRHKGKYSLTMLGKIVYDSQMIIGRALSYYWKLKAVESIEMSSPDLPAEEITQLINVLINDHQIKDILMKAASVRSQNTSEISSLPMQKI